MDNTVAIVKFFSEICLKSVFVLLMFSASIVYGQQVPAQGSAAAALANPSATGAAIPVDKDLQRLSVPSNSQSTTSNNFNANLNAVSSPPVSTYNSSAASNPVPPESDPAVVDVAREQAFNQLTLNTLPMTPAQIQKLRNLFADSNRAATAAPGGAPPKPVASTQLVRLDPGTTPPIIRLSQGYVTSLVFLDRTGAPWPIQSYDIGNPSAFNIQWDRTSNILLLQSSVLYTTGNLVVQLKGLNTPVSISLIPGQPIVDYRVDMRIEGMGPNAKPGEAFNLPLAANNELLNVLDGVPPPKAKALSIPGDANSQAWLLSGKNDRMYLRTHFTVLSPAWIASMSSPDGTNAYEMPRAPSILVSGNDGKIFNLRVEGY